MGKSGFYFDDPDPPHVQGSATSHAAAVSMKSSANAIRSKIKSRIQAAGVYGKTCDEIEAEMDLRHQTASARIRELALAGLIKDSGAVRPTRSKRNAVIWVVP